MKRVVVLCGAVFACTPKDGVTSLITTTGEASSAKCPSGGVLIRSGADKNFNGTLDSDEVQQTSDVCAGPAGTNGMNGLDGGNGANGSAALVETAALPPGDAHCSSGGTRIDTGVDDGRGGGIANDGMLQMGELTGTRYVCNGAFPYYPGSTTPPAGPTGQFQILASGGTGAAGEGGPGASVRVSMNGSLGGHVKVFSTGMADAGFAVPATVPFNGGTTPMMVSNTMTLHAYAGLSLGTASGDPFFRVTGDDHVYTSAGDVVTSIAIASGKTLHIENPTGTDALTLQDDFKSSGTLTSALTPGGDAQPLHINANRFVTAPGSSVMLDGNDNTGAGSHGGNGGSFTVVASAILINQGSISSRGGAADSGGGGGNITLNVTTGPLFNTGALTSTGGNGSSSAGGDGAQVQLNAPFTPVFNAGAVTTSGGSGATGGGAGGVIYFGEEQAGPLRNSGALNAKGGPCTNSGCIGGRGGQVMLLASGGELVSAGDIDSTGAEAAGLGTGGQGGPVTVQLFEQSGPAGNAVVPVTGITLSGNITTKGGNGGYGGSAGDVDVTMSTNQLPLGQEIVLLGYTKLDASAGASGGLAMGGPSGQVSLQNGTSNYYGLTAPGGGAYLYADVLAKGGDGYQGSGGGAVRLTTQTGYNFGNANEQAGVFSTTLDVSGGAGHSYSGGNAGIIDITGVAGVVSHAKLNANGGLASGSPAAGGAGGTVNIAADYGAASSTATVSLNGGPSSGNGGTGGALSMTALSCDVMGTVTAAGGNASLTGGSGGSVFLWSTGATPTASTATFDVNGGTGSPLGSKGSVTVDGADVTP